MEQCNNKCIELTYVYLIQSFQVSLTVQNLSGIETDHEIDVILKTVEDIKSKVVHLTNHITHMYLNCSL